MMAHFWYSKDGRLYEFEADSPVELVNGKDERPFIKFMSSQPDTWNISAADIQKELRREGAKYTSEDKDRLLKDLPREGLTKVFGNFEILSVAFKEDGGWGSEISTLGHWVVTVKAPLSESAPQSTRFISANPTAAFMRFSSPPLNKLSSRFCLACFRIIPLVVFMDELHANAQHTSRVSRGDTKVPIDEAF